VCGSAGTVLFNTVTFTKGGKFELSLNKIHKNIDANLHSIISTENTEECSASSSDLVVLRIQQKLHF
jgi:hypothetical protein